jgi:putative ABC transport system permease protein
MTVVWLDDLRRDLGYSATLLRRSSLFALTAVFSLAVGIGANTTVFTIANALLFAPAPGVFQPDRIVDIGGGTASARGGFGQISYANYLDLRQRATTLEGVYAYHPVPQPMSIIIGGGAAETVGGTFVTTNYFSILGARPAVGRLFDDRDSDAAGASPIVVLSHRYWTRRFSRDPTVVGRALTISGKPCLIVGVAAERFRGTSILAPDLWTPVGVGPARLLSSREMPWPLAGGRLKPGVSTAASAAEIDAIGRALEREYPEANRGKRLRLVPATPIPGNILPVTAFLSLLTGIVLLVLLTACANVAGLLLARAATRRREIAVRLALGAGRGRLTRQLLTETLLLFAFGGAAALALARAMTTLVVALLPALPLPVDVTLPLDARVAMFTAALSFGAAVLSGLAPALHASRADVMSTLKDEPHGPSDRLRVRRLFVVGEVAISVLLVVGATLFMRAIGAASAVKLGFDPAHVEVTSLDLSLAGYGAADGRAFARDLVERAARLPGVAEAAMASTGAPVGDGRRTALVRAPASSEVSGPAPSQIANWNAVDHSYFATMHISIVAGRAFAPTDSPGAPPVAVIGEAAARSLFADRSAADVLGRTIVLQMGMMVDSADGGRVDRVRGAPEMTLTVVGVARDIKYFGAADNRTHLFVYIPLQQQTSGTRLTLITRTATDRRAAPEIRSLLASINPNLPIVSTQRLEEWLAVSLIPQRLAASISGALGAVGFLLAATGIFGITAYVVARRTREIGVRVALGATRRDVVVMILRQGLALAVAGCGIGLILAAAAARLAAGFLLGAALDPVVFAVVSAATIAVGLGASYVPVRRALRVDPIAALRAE